MKNKIKVAIGLVKKYGYNSILLRQYIISLSIIIIVTIFVYTSIFYSIQQLFKNEIVRNNHESLLKVKNTIDGILKDTKNMAEYLCVNDITQLHIISKKNDYIINDLNNKLMDLIKSYMLVNQYLNSITIYSENNDIVITEKNIFSEKNLEDFKWYKEYKNSNETGINIYYNPKEYNIPDTISIEKVITLNFDPQKNKAGVIVINIDTQKFKQYIYDEKEMLFHDVLMLNNDNDILYSNNNKFIGSKFNDVYNFENQALKDGDKVKVGEKQYELRTIYSKENNFKYVSLVDSKKYYNKLDAIKQTTLFGIVIFILMGAIVSIYIATNFFRPLQSIMDIIENDDVSKTDVNSIIKRLNNNEIKHIVTSISNTISTKLKIEDELKKRLLMLQKSQIGALQAQINPHFLYNTLNMFSWMAVEGGNKNLSEAIVNLSDLFRISLDMENYTIPIAKEIEHAKLYIAIAKMRYENEFEVIWEIPDDIMRKKIVKICIQPIIENAIIHGLKPKEEKGFIIIRGYKKDNDIIIEVEDNGVGMREKEVKNLNNMFKTEYLMSDDCVGLRNVNLRLKLIYGDDYLLKLESLKGKGTKVNVSIPNTFKYGKIEY